MFKREKGARAPLSMAWWKYALVAVSDVEANFLLVKAFGAGATITSVMLLDCATIPFVLILSYCFLAKVVSRVRRACMRDSSDARIPFLCQYSRVHMAGACMCVVGLSLLVESDILSKNAAGGSSSMLGDVLVILGSASYSLSNVAQEAVVKHYDRVQYATAQLQPPPPVRSLTRDYWFGALAVRVPGHAGRLRHRCLVGADCRALGRRHDGRNALLRPRDLLHRRVCGFPIQLLHRDCGR
jgi:hypothetical protein